MEQIGAFLQTLYQKLQWPIIKTGETEVTVWSLVYLLVLVLLLMWVARRIQLWLANGPLLQPRLDLGARQAVGTLARYLVLLIGLLAIVQTAGIDLTTFNVLAGAVGIGVGFGLQNVVSNFIAGVIIMFERPIKIGDRIVVDEVEGNVVEIGARGTTVLGNDNIAVIVPNSKFITENVINWKYRCGSAFRSAWPMAAMPDRSNACCWSWRPPTPTCWRTRRPRCGSWPSATTACSSSCAPGRPAWSTARGG